MGDDLEAKGEIVFIDQRVEHILRQISNPDTPEYQRQTAISERKEIFSQMVQKGYIDIDSLGSELRIVFKANQNLSDVSESLKMYGKEIIEDVTRRNKKLKTAPDPIQTAASALVADGLKDAADFIAHRAKGKPSNDKTPEGWLLDQFGIADIAETINQIKYESQARIDTRY